MARPEGQKALLERYFADLSQASAAWSEGGAWTMERSMREGYHRVVWVWRSVEAIAGNSSRLKYRIREGANVIDDHPNYRVLNGKANPLETGRMFRKRLSAQVLLSPRGAFVETTTSRRGDLLRVDLAPPGRTRPVPGKGADVISHFVIDPYSYGQKPRIVEPENMRWVREAHPTDPYGAVTPLEAIGLSIELDHFARLYNASFMRNDGRPGGILGIKGDVEDWEMDRVEARFGGGPMDAGRLSVVAGDLDYVDVAKTPRDAQYVQSSSISKTEILVGFGVPESVIGNASGKTFANAEAEEYAFWTVTMTDHNDLVVTAFDEDSEDGLEGFLDTSKVEVLQRPAIAAREEARKEVSAGLRSPYSYAQLAGIDDVESTPQTRALYISGSVIPLASTEADIQALAALAPGAAAAAPAEGAAPGGVAAADQAATPPGGFVLPPTRSAAALPVGSSEPGRSEVIPDGAPKPRAIGSGGDNVLPFLAPGQKGLPVPSFTVAHPRHGETPEQAVERHLRERKAADLGDGDPGPASRVDPLWREAAETAIASRLENVADRMTGVVAARLRSQKSRKGTRHWEPEFAVDTRLGEKALDSEKIVDVERWQTESREALEAYLGDLVQEAAALLILDLGLDPDGPEAKALSRRLANLVPAKALPQVLAVAQRVLRLVEVSAERRAALFADLISEKEGEGLSLSDIVDAVKALGAKGEDWAKGLALHVTTAAVEGARDAIVEHYADPDIIRRWRSQRDGRVRPTHVKADGQEQLIGEPFEVGTALLRYPGDPDAPMHETANCRCYIVFRSRSTGQFRPRPAGQRDRKGLITGSVRPRSICPGCGDTVEFDETDGWQRLDGSLSHGEPGDEPGTHSDYLEPPTEAKAIVRTPGGADKYDQPIGSTIVPDGRLAVGTRTISGPSHRLYRGMQVVVPGRPEDYSTDEQWQAAVLQAIADHGQGWGRHWSARRDVAQRFGDKDEAEVYVTPQGTHVPVLLEADVHDQDIDSLEAQGDAGGLFGGESEQYLADYAEPAVQALWIKKPSRHVGRSTFGDEKYEAEWAEVRQPRVDPRTDLRHLPGRHDQASHGNAYRAKPGVNVTPGRRLKPEERELIRKGRARLYGVTPPPLLNARDQEVAEQHVTDSAEDQARHAALAQMLDVWDAVPPGVTAADIAEWRGEWVDEYPDTHPDEDAEKFAALDDAFIAGWAAEWHSRPWKMEDDDAVDPATQARLDAAKEAAEKIKADQERLAREAALAREKAEQDRDGDAWAEDAERTAADLQRRQDEAGGEPILGRRRKATAESKAREQYDLYVENAWRQAVDDTNGAIFSAEGKRLGIDDMTLFTGRLTRRYASEELLEWWTKHPRLTWTQFRAQALGRDSDRRRGQNRRTYTGVE